MSTSSLLLIPKIELEKRCCISSIFTMSFVQTQHMFRPQMSLYIPSVIPSTTEEQIKYVFRMLDLGLVSRVDFVEKDNGLYMAFVHFEYWLINNISYFLQERIQSEGQSKIVYDDPHYWIVMENKNPRTAAEIELEKRIHGLEERVRYLETVVTTQTRKLIDNGICTVGEVCNACWTVYEDENADNCPACDTETHSKQTKITDYMDRVSNEGDIEITVDAEGMALAEADADAALEREEAEALAMTGALSSETYQGVDGSGSRGWWPFS